MEIIILLSLFIAWRISKRHAMPQKHRQDLRKARQPARAAPPEKAATAERKAAYEKNRAYHDMISADKELQKLFILRDLAAEDYNSGGPAQQRKALKEIISIDKRITAAENRLEKAKYIYQTTED